MTTPASPVVTAEGFVIQNGGAGVPQLFTIYTVQSGVPERIEAVNFSADFGSNLETDDVLSIQIYDQSGVLLYEQATPPLLGVDEADLTAYLTWSRQGNDNTQQAVQETLFAHDNVRRVWCNMRLPDLVVQNGSFVNLAAWFNDGDEGGGAVVSDIAVTVTRNAGAVSDTTQVTLTPLLLNQSTG